jgi:hypothetical protein
LWARTWDDLVRYGPLLQLELSQSLTTTLVAERRNARRLIDLGKDPCSVYGLISALGDGAIQSANSKKKSYSGYE